MRHNKLALYIRCIWTTWDRLPLITSEVERSLHHCISGEAQELGCKALALNGTEDHVHILVELPPTLAISQLMKQLKGVSSLMLNEQFPAAQKFKWQASYAAFTVSRWDVKKVMVYIQNQKEHHAQNTVIDALEAPLSFSD